MDETEIDLRNVIGLLRRQFRLILTTMLLVVAAAALVTFSLTPIFSSSTLILVDPARKDLLDPQVQAYTSSGDSAKVDSEVEILRSNSVLLRVVESENLVDKLIREWKPSLRQRVLAFFKLDTVEPPSADEAVSAALTALREALSVQRVGLTYVISVQARSPDPDDAARLANAVARAYVDQQLQSKVDNVLSSRDIMQERITQARQNIVDSEGAFDTYIDRNISRIVEETGRTDLARMHDQVAELTNARTESAALADKLQAGLAQNDFTTIVQNLQDQAARQLAERRQQLSQQIASATPAVALDLQAELSDIDEQLREAAQSEVGTLQARVTQAQEQEQQTREQLRSAAVSSGLSADMLAELFDLQQGATLAREQYQRLLGLEQDLATRASLQVADSRIVSPALPSPRPVFPNRPLLLALSGLGALGLGILLAFAYEHLIGGFTTEDQAEAVLKSKVVSSIPRRKGNAVDVSSTVIHLPLSVFSETIRRTRAAIDQWRPQAARAGAASRVIMVTSSGPNEGKTTVAVSLARSYASSGRRVLLIDGDLRKPSVHRQIEVESSMGVLEYLAADAKDVPEIQSLITKDPLSNAILLLGSARSGVPTDDLLTHPSFEKLIDAARKAFEIVVIDTPPVGPIVDGLYVARLVDTVVFVTKWASTSQRDAKAAVASIKSASPDANVLVVLNQLNESRLSYQRKYGGYYAHGH